MTAVTEAYLERYKISVPEITEEELLFVRNHLSVSTLKKNSFYLEAGTVQKSLGFVYEGLLRVFYEDSEGNEITADFVKEGAYATHYGSFSKQEPSKYSFQCLENCTIINLPYDKMNEGVSRYKNLEHYARTFKEGVTDVQQQRIESLLNESAEQRYLNFIKKYPGLFNRVSLTHLASFLGIGRQSLSRIRKNIASK